MAVAQVYSLIRIGTLAKAWHGLLTTMFDPYRPECHYMRGPGPKWRAKHEDNVNP
jgi:hypothetical protein